MNNNIRNDWHQADIIAVLRKRGTTLAAVSREAGLIRLHWQMHSVGRGLKANG